MTFEKQASIPVWGLGVGEEGRVREGRVWRRNSALLVIKLQVHPIVDFI